MSRFKNSLHFRNVNIYSETGGKTPEEKLRDRFKEYVVLKNVQTLLSKTGFLTILIFGCEMGIASRNLN